MSRTELTQCTKLSPTTISSITSELIDRGLVVDLGIGESSGGRRLVILVINPEARYAISIVLKPKGVIYALVDLECNIIGMKEIKCSLKGIDRVKEILAECIQDILSTYGSIKSRITAIGVSAPGIIGNDGCISYSTPLKTKDLDIVGLLKEQVYNVDYFIFKDTDALILGEYNFGIGGEYKNYIYNGRRWSRYVIYTWR